jgi:type VI secretion system secreted protein VgrG
MGTSSTYSALAGSTLTNTGNSAVYGDLGVSAGTSITGIPPGIVFNGTTHSNDASAIQGKIDLTSAYNYAVAQTGAIDLTGLDLGGMTLVPGVYKYTSSAQLTGILTLDGGGDPNSQWIFQIGSTLTTAASSFIGMINGGIPGNVIWQIGTLATLGASNAFMGNILANASITVGASTSIDGRLFARTGAISLSTNVIRG